MAQNRGVTVSRSLAEAAIFLVVPLMIYALWMASSRGDAWLLIVTSVVLFALLLLTSKRPTRTRLRGAKTRS